MPDIGSARHLLLIVLATACWGTGTVISKQVLDRGVSPLVLLAIELGASSMLLGVGALAVGARPRWSLTMAKLALLGVLNPGIAYALGLLGLMSITASLSVLLWATEPIMIMALAMLILREHIAARTAVAVAGALLGVLLIVLTPGASGNVPGVTLTLAAVAACALYTVLTRRLLLDDGSLEVVLVQQVAALAFAVVLAGVSGSVLGSGLAIPADAATWALGAASGVVYYGLAFWFFVAGLRGVPASLAASLYPLIPVFGVGAAALTGDRLTGRQWLGAAIVIVGTATAAVTHLARGTTDSSG